MSLAEFLAYIVTPAGLGVVSSVVLTIIKRVYPRLENGYAFAASILLAGLFAIAGNSLTPYIGRLPPEFEAIWWPVICWVAQQIWFWLTKSKFGK